MKTPTIRVEGAIDAAAVRGMVDALAEHIAAGLPAERWFGDKDRPVSRVAAAGAVVDGFGAATFAWVALDVEFKDGGRAAYAYPLALADAGTTDGPVLARLECLDQLRELVAATDHPAFPDWLLAALAAGRQLAGDGGRLGFSPFAALVGRLEGMTHGPAVVVPAQYSNTVVRYGDAGFLKLFRRLVPGVNLDETITRHLAEQSGFAHVPAPLGAVAWLPEGGEPVPVALAQAFVPNLGDGWGWVQERLAEATPVALGEATAAIRLLGERTGELHATLAANGADPFFAPVAASSAGAAAQAAATHSALTATLADLRQRQRWLIGEASSYATHILKGEARLHEALGGFAAEVGYPRIRVHGDYHLGQVLRTPGSDWTILDFEGEPARPLAERLEKTSPLKDVSGMLHSLGFARAASLLAGGDAASLAEWETAARSAFLAGYAEGVGGAERPLVPADPPAFRAALAAWELDKALYQVRYELANRPDWLPISLGALARFA
jgi:maltose alpha-D-glucosyltransferase/alpha-amylase